jgi:AraC-like DNA-binding protein
VAVVAALVGSRTVRVALRRSLPRGAGTLVTCRTEGALRRALRSRLIEAMVVEPRAVPLPRLRALVEEYPAIPLFVAAAFRPDDGELLAGCARAGMAVLVEGVDDAVSGELVARASTQAVRRRALGEAPRLLRLRTPLQREVWELLIGLPDRPLRTGDLARRIGVTREHLSRQFAVEAAPNLKRVIDLTRVAAAAQLLANPGHTAADVAAILRFASASHLNRTSRRIAGAGTRRLADLGPRGVLEAFARGKTRSRL